MAATDRFLADGGSSVARWCGQRALALYTELGAPKADQVKDRLGAQQTAPTTAPPR
jgi:hypothetical protein